MARRSKEDASERRTEGLRLQLTPTERAILEQRAQTAGLLLSEFARVVLLSDLKAPAPPARTRANLALERGYKAAVALCLLFLVAFNPTHVGHYLQPSYGDLAEARSASYSFRPTR